MLPIPILAALIGAGGAVASGAVSSYVGNKTAPKQPRYPTFGPQGGAYGAQNPAVMQMLSALMGSQQQGQQQNRAAQQQALAQLLQSMIMQSQMNAPGRTGVGFPGPVSPLPPGTGR